MTRRQWFIGCLASIVVACSQGPERQGGSVAADQEAIRRTAAAIMEAEAAGDFERFLSFHTDDVVMLPPDQPVVRGKAAFASLLRPFFDQFTLQETLSFSDIRVVGDWAAGTYTYVFDTTAKTGGAVNREEGKGVFFLRRSADGSWKIMQAVWNRDHVAPSPVAK